MRVLANVLTFAALAGVAATTGATASPLSAFRPDVYRMPATTIALAEGRAKLAPMPFVVFCLQYPADCPAASGANRIELTPERFAELDAVNRRVNASIRPENDTSQGRFWKLDVSVGDCNEFAVAKRHALIEAGWPAAALSLTVARTTWGEGHLLVTVRTDHGDLILDSLRPDIVAWNEAHYHWIMRQSADNTATWVSLEGQGRVQVQDARLDQTQAPIQAQDQIQAHQHRHHPGRFGALADARPDATPNAAPVARSNPSGLAQPDIGQAAPAHAPADGSFVFFPAISNDPATTSSFTTRQRTPEAGRMLWM